MHKKSFMTSHLSDMCTSSENIVIIVQLST